MTGKQAHVAEAMCAFDAKLRGLMLESGLFPDGQTVEDWLSVFRGWSDLRTSPHADQPQRLKGLCRDSARTI